MSDKIQGLDLARKSLTNAYELLGAICFIKVLHLHDWVMIWPLLEAGEARGLYEKALGNPGLSSFKYISLRQFHAPVYDKSMKVEQLVNPKLSEHRIIQQVDF